MNLTWWIVAAVAFAWAEYQGIRSSVDLVPTATDLIRLAPDWVIAFGLAVGAAHFRVGTAVLLKALDLLGRR